MAAPPVQRLSGLTVQSSVLPTDTIVTVRDNTVPDFRVPVSVLTALGGNVSNVTTPAAPAGGQIAAWTDATHIRGLPGAGSPSTMFLRGDNTWQVPVGGGSGAANFFDTREGAAGARLANIPLSVNSVVTAGYARAGDGGGATYVQSLSGGTEALQFPSYGFQDAGGRNWEYVPEHDGWNAKVAGVAADGSTDDSSHMQDALLPFQNPAVVFNGGNLAGVLILPAGVISLHSPVIVTGSNSGNLKITGQLNGNFGVIQGTCFQWHGIGYPSMFIIYGVNCSIFKDIGFDGSVNSTTSGLINCVHFTADNTYVDALTSNVLTPGVNTFHVTSSAGLVVGTALGIGAGAGADTDPGGTASFEIVYVSSIPDSTSFVATSARRHLATEKVGGGPPGDNIIFDHCTFNAPLPYVDNRSCGLLVGNFTVAPSGTVQAASTIARDCVFLGGQELKSVTLSITGGKVVVTESVAYGMLANTPIQFLQGDTLYPEMSHFLTYYVRPIDSTTYNLSLTPGGPALAVSGSSSGTHRRLVDPYGGIRAIGGGNIKNYFIENCNFNSFQYHIAGESLSGSVEILYATFGSSFVSDILANGAQHLHVVSAESEGAGNAFVIGGSISNPGNALIEECSYQCGLPSNLYVINWAANLTLIENQFENISSEAPTTGVPPRIKCAGISKTHQQLVGVNMTSGVASIGNYYQFGDPSIPVFYDGSDNPWGGAGASVDNSWRVFQDNDYGDIDVYQPKFGGISSATAGLSNELLPAGVQFKNQGIMSSGCTSLIVPYTLLTATGADKNFILNIPARTKITGVVADVTAAFAGTVGSMRMRVGTAFAGATNLLPLFVLTGFTGQKGLLDADVGSDLKKAAAFTQDGVCNIWGGDQLFINFHADNTDMNLLTAGSVTVYITTSRFN